MKFDKLWQKPDPVGSSKPDACESGTEGALKPPFPHSYKKAGSHRATKSIKRNDTCDTAFNKVHASSRYQTSSNQYFSTASLAGCSDVRPGCFLRDPRKQPASLEVPSLILSVQKISEQERFR